MKYMGFFSAVFSVAKSAVKSVVSTVVGAVTSGIGGLVSGAVSWIKENILGLNETPITQKLQQLMKQKKLMN